MKKIILALFMAALLGLPSMVMAEGSLLKGEEVTVEGTIQGLLSACTGQLCVPGEENIIAGGEDTFVLSVGKDTFYYLPNVKSTLLSRYLGRTVRVKGVKALGGDSIIVETAQAMHNGNWENFYSPELREKIMERYEKFAIPAPAY